MAMWEKKKDEPSQNTKTATAVQNPPSTQIAQTEVKKAPTHMGTCSFGKVNKTILASMSERKECSVLFEEKRTGDVWEIDLSIKKIPAELKTDDQGRVWKRIS